MLIASIVLDLPDWLEAWWAGQPAVLPDPADRMRLVIELARLNVQRRTGGPFAAMVFERDTGRLIAPGVNGVLAARCSVAHAEIMALAAAQQLLGSHDLSAAHLPACQLVSSVEPCAMCLGAVPWSGIRSLVCGAREEDARRIGFDEGAKPRDWPGVLAARGIGVTQDLLRQEAAAVLDLYVRLGGVIYNACSPAAGA